MARTVLFPSSTVGFPTTEPWPFTPSRAVGRRAEAVPTVASVLSGHTGSIEYRAGLYASDVEGSELMLLDTVNTMSGTLDNSRQAAWEMSVSMIQTDALNPISDYVKAVLDIKLGSTWERYGMGLYRFFGLDEDYLNNRRVWNLRGNSGEELLAGRQALRSSPWPQIQGHHVPPGRGVLAEVRRILTQEFGIPGRMILFPIADVTLLKGMIFDVVQNAQGTYWLAICNSLLAAGGFHRLRQDKNGVYVTRKRADLAEKVPGIIIGPAPYEDIVDADEVLALTRDFGQFANQVTVISNDVNQIPPVAATVASYDENHPYSITSMDGYVKTWNVQLQQAIAKPQAEALAREELSRRMSVPDNYSFTTPLDPRRDVDETYETRYYERSGKPIFVGRHHVEGFGFSLAPPIQHEP